MTIDRWALIGWDRVDNYYGEPEEEEVIATFDTQQAAHDYIKKARLKRPNWSKTFRDRSLLSCFRQAYVEPWECPEPPPHNPPLPK